MKHGTTGMMEHATLTPANETPQERAVWAARRKRDERLMAKLIREAADLPERTEWKRNLISFDGLPEPVLDSLAEDECGKLWCYRRDDLTIGDGITPATIFFRMSRKAARVWFSERNAEASGYGSEPDFFDTLLS
jgi:hypothetical protein